MALLYLKHDPAETPVAFHWSQVDRGELMIVTTDPDKAENRIALVLHPDEVAAMWAMLLKRHSQ